MAPHRGLPHVDPTVSRGRLYRAYVRFLGTRFAAWLSRNVVWKVDPHVLRLTGGRLGLGLVLPTALLETRGARSGRLRRNAVVYFHDGDRVTIIASKLGAPEHPSWFHNARANPGVQLGGQPFRVEVVEDEATRARLWELADRIFPPYASYRERAAAAGRTIPILQLVPRVGHHAPVNTDVDVVADGRPPDALVRRLNAVLRRVLTSPLGRRLSKLAVIEVDGRRSGRRHRIVAGWYEADGRCSLCADDPERDVEPQPCALVFTPGPWRANFVGGADALVWRGGKATLYRGVLHRDPAAVARALNATREMGTSARALGLRVQQHVRVEAEDVRRLDRAAIHFRPAAAGRS